CVRLDKAGAGRGRVEAELVDKGGIIAAVRVKALESDGVAAGRYREGVRGVACVASAQPREGADDLPIDQDFEGLSATPVGPLRSLEADLIGASRHVDVLTDGASHLEEADLGSLGRIGIAAGEATAVACDAGAPVEDPGRAARIVLEISPTAGVDVWALEASITYCVDVGLRGGRDFAGEGAFAGTVDCRDFVEVRGAVGHAAIGERRAGNAPGDQCLSATGGALINVVAIGTRRCRPVEVHLAVASRGRQVGGGSRYRGRHSHIHGAAGGVVGGLGSEGEAVAADIAVG